MIALLCGSLGACFSEASGDGDDDDDETSTPADSSTTVPGTTEPTSTVSTSSDPTTEGTTVFETTGDSSATDPSATTTTEGTTESTTGDVDPACPNDGDPACDDGMAVPGEVCLEQTHLPGTSSEQHDRLVITDVTGDGFVDAVVGDGSLGFVLLENDGQGALTPIAPEVALLGWSVDAAVVVEREPAHVLVGGFDAESHLFQYQDGMLVDTRTIPEPGGGAVIARFIDIDNVNGPDIVTSSIEAAGEQLHVYVGDGLGGFAVGPDTFDIQAGGETTIEEFRGFVDPAHPFAAMVFLLTDGRLVVLADGALEEVDAVNVFLPNERPVLVNADLDGDDLDDLVVASSGRAYLYLYNSDTQSFSSPNILGENVGTRVGAAVGDINRDGRSDVVIAEHDTNTLYTYLQTGAGYAPPTEIALGALAMPVGATIGLVNGDCAPDLVVFNTSSVWTFLSNP